MEKLASLNILHHNFSLSREIYFDSTLKSLTVAKQTKGMNNQEELNING